MTRDFEQITVSLDAEAVSWARQEATRRGTSVSRFLGALIERTVRESGVSDPWRSRFFSQSPGVHRVGDLPLPGRDELHERRGPD